MDFTLIKEHPWMTAGIVAAGAFVLYLALRKPASSSDQMTGGYYAGGGAVDNTATIAQYQAQSQLALATLQSQTQLGLAQIAAGPNATVQTSADVQNRQTDAQTQLGLAQIAAELNLGLNTQSSQIELARLQAGLQGRLIDALESAYGGHTPTSPTPITNINTTPPNGPPLGAGGPNLPQSYYSNLPVAPITVTTPGGGYPTNLPTDGSILPGGSLLVPAPTYANCDPRDVACVSRNQTASINWENANIAANAENNRRQCLANASLSAGFPNYASLVAACG